MNWNLKLYKLAISLLCLASAISCRSGSEKTSRINTLPYYDDASFTPHWFDDAPPEGFHRIPSFELTDQEGNTITERTFHDKIYVVDFFFTSCPGICPKMTKNMHVLQEEFIDDDNVLLLAHSVTPDYDSVSVLRAYAEKKGIQSEKWHLVTGDRKQIYHLGRDFYFVEEDLGLQKSADDFLHTENFVLIDQNKYIRGIHNGLSKSSVQQLIADIKLLEGG